MTQISTIIYVDLIEIFSVNVNEIMRSLSSIEQKVSANITGQKTQFRQVD